MILSKKVKNQPKTKGIKSLIAVVCCFIYFCAKLQPVYGMGAENEGQGGEIPVYENLPSIMGGSCVLMEVSTGTILYEKNMHDVHYPASITKIMTVLLAIENCEMDEIVTVPFEAVYMEDKGSHIALDAGEQLTVEQCLYAVMLASANDAAYALAAHVGGTYEDFILMMNEKAKEIGCRNTHFTNPHGLPDESHVTSAYDMALITKHALQFELFRTVSGTPYYEILPTEYQKDLICMYNHHKMIGKTKYYNEEVVAGKNGYTRAAGQTLVTCASRDDMDVVCVIMGDQGEEVYQDTLKLLNYGFEGFSKVRIAEDKADLEEMLRKENPIFKDCFISGFDADNAYIVIPRGAKVSDLKMQFVYGEAEKIMAQYFYEDRLAGQVGFIIDKFPAESGSFEKAVKEALSEEKESGESLFRRVAILVVSVTGILMGGIFFKVFLERNCSRKRNRLGIGTIRRGVRRKCR